MKIMVDPFSVPLDNGKQHLLRIDRNFNIGQNFYFQVEVITGKTL